MIASSIKLIKQFLFLNKKETSQSPLEDHHRLFLNKKVSFFNSLNATEKASFEKRILLFLDSTEIIGHDVDVDDEDCLLIAAAAIILVWKIPEWHYINLHTVYLVSSSFNDQAKLGQADSTSIGLVGNGDLYGKMILSKPALHHGFNIENDKHNVALHEFAHLIDMQDGTADGFPERLKQYAFAAPWLELIRQETIKIHQGTSKINDYAATNSVEFFAVATEYFFENPKLLLNKHPEIYKTLNAIYKNDMAAIEQTKQPRKKQPCPCGSGKRYKRCCLV